MHRRVRSTLREGEVCEAVLEALDAHGRRGATVFVIGVDENGLGPTLGPLVVTGVGLSLGRYAVERCAALGRELGIDDSKTTAAFGKMAQAESLALAACEVLWGCVPDSVDALFGRLFRRAPVELQRTCPPSTRAQCWSEQLTLPAFGGELPAGRDMLAGLLRAGIAVRFARSEIICTSELNTRLIAGQSRLDVDLNAMEQLVLDARHGAGEDVRAVCGMVGGIRNYSARFRHFAPADVRPRPANVHGPIYDVAGVGRVAFEIDADQRHLPVAFASMIGKYVRELWMARQNAFYRTHLPEMKAVSGYHDPVTQRFIVASEALRAALRIDNGCFVRNSAKDERAKLQLPLL